MIFGSGQPLITGGQLKKINVNFPNLSEQNKIGNFLSLLDKKIELQTKKIEVLKLYKKGMLNQTINFNITINLDKCVIYQEGPGVRSNQYTNYGVKLLNVGNFKNNHLDLSTTNRYISESEANGIYKHFLINEGDLLIACSGIKSEYFHEKIAIAAKEHLPLCMNTSTMRFKIKDDNVLTLKYLFYILQTNNIKKQLDNILSGSAQLNFGPSHIKYIKIPLISLEEQNTISIFLDLFFQKILLETKKLDLINELKKGLMQDMFV